MSIALAGPDRFSSYLHTTCVCGIGRSPWKRRNEHITGAEKQPRSRNRSTKLTKMIALLCTIESDRACVKMGRIFVAFL